MIDDNEILKSELIQKTGMRTEITIETHSTTVIRSSSGAIETAFCQTCRQHTPDLSTANAAAVLQVGKDELELFASTGEIHLTERGGLCGNSLVEHRRREIRPSIIIGATE